MKTPPSGGTPRAQAAELLLRLKGRLVWSVGCSEYGVLRVNFGKPHLRVHGPYRADPSRSAQVKAALARRVVEPTGDWQLWVDAANWEVAAGLFRASPLAGVPEQKQVLRQLDGQRLLGIRHDQPAARWMFDFDLGGVLTIGPLAPGQADMGQGGQWTLFLERRKRDMDL